MMRAVIYARYSSENQREESIEGQIRECKEYAERNHISVIDIYVDRALSAKTDDRPDFQRMVKESSKRQFEVILVWKLDRFARNRYDSAHYKQILKKNGVKVVSAKENISEGSEGILMESNLSENIHRGQKENALQGKNNGGGIPLGYLLGDDQKLKIDPLTAPVVLEIFQRYADGETTREIVESLNARGLRAKKLDEEQVQDFLRCFQYGDVNDINYRRQLIDCFVNRIFLYDDRMVLTFNTSNNTKEISFDLVEGSDMVEGPPPKSGKSG